MFKNKSSANEILNSFKEYNSQQENIEVNRLILAIDKLSKAATNLEKAGLIKQAEAIDIVLQSLAEKSSHKKREVKNPKSSEEMVKNLLQTGTVFNYDADDEDYSKDEDYIHDNDWEDED